MANIVRDTGVQATSTVPSNMPGSAEGELPQPVTDVEGAKALLAEAGYADGFATQIHVIAPNDIWIPQALAVQQALAEIGITAEINQLPYADMITLEQAGDWEGMKSSQWGSDFPDAAGMLQPLFLSTSVPPQNNHSRYNNPRVDELLAQQDAELDPAAREAMLKEIQTLIAEDAPVLFFEHFKWYMPISTAFTGYEVGPLWYWDCWGRTLRPAGA
jgi:peptide/nickel transport system substrate-binding protein